MLIAQSASAIAPPTLAQAFITRLEVPPNVRVPGIALEARFRIEAYHDGLYPLLGIAFPDLLRRAVPKRRAEFLAGRYLAACALAQFGLPRSTLATGSHRQPIWPTGVRGSISHTRTRALGIVVDQPCRLVGVDLEEFMTTKRARNLARTILCEGEEPHLGGRPEQFAERLTIVFSAKETLFKALFPQVGRYFDFSAARTLALDMDQGRLRLELTEALGSYGAGERFDIDFVVAEDSVLTYLVGPDPAAKSRGSERPLSGSPPVFG